MSVQSLCLIDSHTETCIIAGMTIANHDLRSLSPLCKVNPVFLITMIETVITNMFWPLCENALNYLHKATRRTALFHATPGSAMILLFFPLCWRVNQARTSN